MSRSEHNIDLWLHGYFGQEALRYQQYFYHAPQKHKMLVAGIRTGKSRLVSFGFLHYAQYHPYARLLNTSISSEQAKIVFTNCLEYCNAPKFRHWIEHIQASPYPLIRLTNGAELWFRSIGYDAELIRGFEFDLINIDEAAYVTRKSAYDTLRGRLLGVNPYTRSPRAGIMWLVTSPKGQGWLADLWKKGDSQFVMAEVSKYLSLRATIFDNPFLSQELLADLMADYTDAMIRQEMYGEFLDNLDAVFPYQLVMACCDPDAYEVRHLYNQIADWNRKREATKSPIVLPGEVRESRIILLDQRLSEDISHYECEPEAGHRYVNSWDLGKKATSKGRNAMVGMIWDITHEPWTLAAYRYSENMGYVEAKNNIESWHEKYNGRGATCRTVIDSTGKGDVLEEFMLKEQSVDDLQGIVYSSANKPNLIHAGKLMIERGNVRFPFIRKMVDQLTNYEILDKDLAQDIVMCFCQAMYAARDMTRLSTRADRQTLQRTLNSMPQYSQRIAQVRLNPRYIESRLGRRQARQKLLASRRR